VSPSPNLVLLTSAFPFGNKSETFLESEIEVLARRFPRILVLPSHREPGVRRLPGNVELVEMGWLEEPPRREKLRALASDEAVEVMRETLTGVDGRSHLRSPRIHLDILARNVLKLRELSALLDDRPGLRDAVFYDYWFENSTLALALARRRGIVRAAACRAHGFDLYDERWEGGLVPFRAFKLTGLDLVAPVSEFGTRYLKERAPGSADNHIRTFRLGVRPQPDHDPPPSDPPLVLSVGSMLPAKRVALVPEVLARVGRALRWVHLGDGPARPAVEAAAGRLPERVRWELRGHVDNAEVLRFYRENGVAAMLSLSVSEGLPVSMMEALSFGVPVVSPGVHGVPEAVNEVTGVLLQPDAGVEETAVALCSALEPERFDRRRIRAFFRERFEAGANYDRFADALIALREDQAPAR
jgi:glycosyltransferase involved in cell wall biosynthesis